MREAPHPIRIRLWYDFSSTLCYVALRVVERLAPALDEHAIAFDWTPLDMTQLLGAVPYGRGREVSERRRQNALEIAASLEVPLTGPAVWHDSRAAAATAYALHGSPHEATWRERVFSAVFEQGRPPPDPDEAVAWTRDLGFAIEIDQLDAGRDALEAQTERARGEMVGGVPTFMLGEWAFGGIQTDTTMLQVLGRFAEKQREAADA